MKPIIQFDYSQNDYSGEFIEPNIIKIYVNTLNITSTNPLFTIVHEYVHFIIFNSKILSFVFDKLNTYVSRKQNGKDLYKGFEIGEIYFDLPEEIICNKIAKFVCDKYVD